MSQIDLREIYAKGVDVLRRKKLYNWCEDGAETSSAVKGNEAVFKQYFINMRTMHDIKPDTSATLFGKEIRAPIGTAPMFVEGLDPKADEIIIKGASRAQCPVFLRYFADNKKIKRLIKHAKVPIYWVLAPTNDLKELKRDFKLAEEVGVAGVGIVADASRRVKLRSKLFSYVPKLMSTEDYRKVRTFTDLPLFIKGVLTVEEAKICAKFRYDGLYISNHGGRVLDYATPPLYALEQIAKFKFAKKLTLIIDGGFRTATDIFKALALGANFVALGRPVIYGLAANKIQGVANVLNYLCDDLARAMAMTGNKTIKEISKRNIVRLNILE